MLTDRIAAAKVQRESQAALRCPRPPNKILLAKQNRLVTALILLVQRNVLLNVALFVVSTARFELCRLFSWQSARTVRSHTAIRSTSCRFAL